MSTPLSTTLVFRQSEVHDMLRMAPHTAAYTSAPFDIDALVAALESQEPFWREVIECYNDASVRRNHLARLEDYVLAGLPDLLRGAVYAKVLQVKHSIDKNTYASLVRGTELRAGTSEMPLSAVDPAVHRVLRVFEHCLSESSPVTLRDARTRTYRFVADVAALLINHCTLGERDVLALLFRFAELHTRLAKDEFAYKACRAVEHVAAAQYMHVVMQGIDLEQFFGDALHGCLALGADERLRVKLLDLVVFEGFDSVARVLVAQFVCHADAVLARRNRELADYLSGNFLADVDETAVERLVKVEFPLIMYENEFYLMNANAISSNDQELLNMKEAYDELMHKKADLEARVGGLLVSHQEIQSQNDDFARQLRTAQRERHELADVHTNLLRLYARLTMQENLRNTVNANEDISRSNQDLEGQIRELEAAVEKKSAKLAKLAKLRNKK